MKSKIILGVMILLFANLSSAAVSSDVLDPGQGEEHFKSDDLVVSWSSENTDSGTRDIGSSEVRLEDEQGRSIIKEISRDASVPSGDSVQTQITVTSSELGDLSAGDVQVSILDSWEDMGGNLVPKESQDSNQFKLSESSDGPSDDPQLTGSVSIDGVSPSDDASVDVVGGFDVVWNSNNNYTGSRELGSSDVELTGPNGRGYSTSIDRGVSVGEDSSVSYTLTLSESDISDISTGTWTLSLGDTWPAVNGASEDTADQNLDFSTTNSSSTDSGGDSGSGDLSGNVSLEINDPSEGSSENISNGFDVKWSSINNYDGSRTLDYSRLEVVGSSGRSVVNSPQRGSEISQGSSVDYTVSFSESDLSDLNAGDWSLEVQDTWASRIGAPEESVSESISFSVSSSSDGDGTTDDSTDGSDDDTVVVDDSQDSTDSTTDGSNTNTTDGSQSSSDSSDDSDGTDSGNDDSDNTDTTEQSTDSGSDDDSSSTGGVVTDDGSVSCPDGFSYDEEREVCVEDTSDSNTSASESSEETDETSSEPTGEPSPLQQEVVGGITVQTIGIVGLIILVVGLLFRRSSYKLAF